jgi:hypothetical protein
MARSYRGRFGFVWFVGFVLLLGVGAVCAQTQDDHLAQLERRLQVITDELATVRAEIAKLKSSAVQDVAPTLPKAAVPKEAVQIENFRAQVLGLSQGVDRKRTLNVRPNVFLQTRFSTFPLDDATPADYPSNFRISRLETRWAGSVNKALGAGVELQYQPAPDGSPDQIINDAFIDYYARPWMTLRAGQFVKPFGFDVQQPNRDREMPERAMFAGYLFPGERDRGMMMLADLGKLLPCTMFDGMHLAIAAVNGNRFYADSNRQLNYLVRVRRLHKQFAWGGSVQLGIQPTPAQVNQTNNENVFGLDAQWAIGRLGLRAEFAHGNRPATMVTRDVEFNPTFIEGERVRTVGWTLSGLWSFSANTQAYLRFDRLGGDTIQLCPQSKDGSCKSNSVNGGVRWIVAQYGIFGIDVQRKDRVSHDRNGVNTRLQVTSGIVF